MWCITEEKPPKMQGSYCFSVKLLVFSSMLRGNSSLIYLCISCKVSDGCRILFIPSWLWPPKKNERGGEATERDVGKEKRGKIWIHPTKKNIYVHHFHQQSGIHSKLQNQFCQYGNLVGQFSYWPTVSLYVSLLKLNSFLRKHLFGIHSLKIFKISA